MDARERALGPIPLRTQLFPLWARKPQAGGNRRQARKRRLIGPTSIRTISGGAILFWHDGKGVARPPGNPAARACEFRVMRSYRVQGRERTPAAATSAIASDLAASRARPAATRTALLGGVWLGALAMLAPDAAHAVDGTWQGPGNQWTTGHHASSSPDVP